MCGERGRISDQERAVNLANLGLQDFWKLLGWEARLKAILLRSERGGGKISWYDLANLALVCTMRGGDRNLEILQSCTAWTAWITWTTCTTCTACAT